MVQKLVLSPTGVQKDEISEEDFSHELHHALESSISELSASVLADNTSVDDTFAKGLTVTHKTLYSSRACVTVTHTPLTEQGTGSCMLTVL